MRWILLGLSMWFACGDAGAPRETSRAAATSTARPAPPAPLLEPSGCAEWVPEVGGEVARGVCYAHEYRDEGARGYGSETSGTTLDELRALGVDTVSLTPFGFMRGSDDPEIRFADTHASAETNARLEREVSACRARGLRVMLKPHLWVRGGAWVGTLDMRDEASWTRWLASYRAFVLHYARFAATHALPSFVIGVELDPIVIRFEAFFRGLVAEVREIYDGEILYAANWDRAVDVGLWDAVDAIGVQFYPPLADVPDAPREAIDSRLSHYMEVLEGLHRRVARPIVFTEVGYRSAPDAEVRPHAWPEHDAEVRVSLATQRRAYEAFFESLRGRAFVRGVYVWKWFTDPETRDEGPDGFSPRGKPAEAVLRAAYRGCER